MFTSRPCLAAATATVRAVKRRSLIPTKVLRFAGYGSEYCAIPFYLDRLH